MNTACCLIAFCAAAIQTGRAAPTADELATIRRELPAALQKLEASFSNLSCSGTVTESKKPLVRDAGGNLKKDASGKPVVDMGADFAVFGHYKISYWVDGASIKSSVFDLSRPSAGDAQTKEVIICIGPSYSYIIELNPKDRTPVLKRFAADLDLRKNMEHSIADRLHVPFSIADVPFSKIMSDPSFSIREVSKLNDRGADCLKIVYDYDGKKQTSMRSGWVVVAPGEGWAIREFDSDARLGEKLYKNFLHGVVEYSGVQEGTPVPSKITTTLFDVQRRTFDIDRITFRHVPAREFTLSAYGLPEIDEMAKPRGRGFASALFIAAALVAMLIAVVLHLRRKALSSKY